MKLLIFFAKAVKSEAFTNRSGAFEIHFCDSFYIFEMEIQFWDIFINSFLDILKSSSFLWHPVSASIYVM